LIPALAVFCGLSRRLGRIGGDALTPLAIAVMLLVFVAPFPADAQPPAKVHRIGWSASTSTSS
jgi:hypothetical protein